MHFGRKNERFTEEPTSQEPATQKAEIQEDTPRDTSTQELPPEEKDLIDFLSPIKKGKAAKKGHSRSETPGSSKR